MKFLVFLLFSLSLLFIDAAPTKKAFAASSKDLGATLVRVPVGRFNFPCEQDNPTTSAPTTATSPISTPESTGTEPPSTGEEPPSSDGDQTPTGEEPPSSGDDQTPTGEEPPSSGDDQPSSGDEQPSTGDEVPSGSGPPSGTGSCVSCAVDNFKIVNDYRASNGLNRLGWSEHLADLADQWSKEMYDTKVFKHSDFNFWENIIWGQGMYTWDSVAEGFFDGWKNSPGHDQNMKLETHKCMGVGVYGDGDSFYGTQIFSNDCP